MPVTREAVEAVLVRNDAVGMHAVGRALVHLRNRQTDDEIRTESTNHTNNRGFTQAHARRGTSMAAFYERTGFLTKKQVEWWQSSASEEGRPRILIYWKQILEEANLKETQRLQAREDENYQMEMDQYNREVAV